ncbi:hypothetical protein LG943_10790 [Streptomonospora sp. S1-112]|uniref:Uncharacterized protein n=1 Tax=Streptomonospora mangrovi TaxID=2883123 RepID=A0A9X3SN43_9ACTN|nr:hypothetical protein [Streptomonospora mangrovi]MDA0564806.1 hypothetical protein [Streptomonospora mangrovi]
MSLYPWEWQLPWVHPGCVCANGTTCAVHPGRREADRIAGELATTAARTIDEEWARWNAPGE